MAYELTGRVKLIQEPQTFPSGFAKREMVVTVEDGNYPQDINLEFLKEKMSLLDSIRVGQKVTVTFDIRGREYNGRYFNNLVGWKIKVVEDAPFNDIESSPLPANEPDEFDDSIPF